MFNHLTMLLIALLASAAVKAESRDPTMPGNLPTTRTTTTESGIRNLNLTAIMISGKNRRALINDESVSIGETLADGSQILTIQPRYVLVRQNKLNKKLYLVPSVKKPVK